MCGICGKADFTGAPVERGTLSAINEKLRHRGPEEDGYYFSPEKNFGMGMRRLKIIDLSTGTQPLFNETQEIAVILNGEIYNYIELRQDLEAKGHQFVSHSDTETIAHAYEEYGLDFIGKLNGMFAFAIYDRRNGGKKVLVARDRIGIKPLYYRSDGKNFSFASEVKALLADPTFKKEIDLLALDDYFSLLYVPGPRSIFQGVKKLEPGHYLLCDLEKKTIENRAYWRRPPIDLNPKDQGLEFYLERLDELFRDALKLQLRSDVPNGLFLSSGLDSGTIAYYASQVSKQKTKSFTIHFADASYSERDGARRIAERCGVEFHDIELEPNAQDLVLKTIQYFDEPFADSSAIPTYLLCQFARQSITVALSGEGGDELFAGYPTYIATKWAPVYKKFPAPLRQAVAAMVRRLPVSWNRISLEFKLKQFVKGAEFNPERSHYAWKEIFTEEDKRTLFSGDLLRAKNGHEGFESFQNIFAELGNGTELEKLLTVDQRTYLLDQFLVKSDRMSMAHALEVRVPILDHRLVEFAATIPAHYKLRGFQTKWILRKLMEGKLPDDVVSGAKKGFSPPLPGWIAGPLKPFIREVLSPSALKEIGFLNEAAVERILSEHFEKKKDHHRRIWALLNFVLWHGEWMK